MTDTTIAGKTALVTGGGRGLGQAAAWALAAGGARVAVADMNADHAAAVANELGSGTETLAVTVDVADSAQVQRMVDTVVEQFGGIDILLHAAGISRGPTQKGPDGWLPIQDVSEEDWNRVLQVNLSGTFLVDQAVARVMIPRGWGRIINVASMSGRVANKGLAGLAPYNASKGGVIALTKALAVEWAPYNISVNCISPGYMATEMGKRSQSMPGFRELQLDQTPAGRLGEPEEFAQAVLFLAGENAAYVTGHDLVMDGGYTAW
jgi:NAD(P)-dependent dehydrogenase (short-subunit alcohol dehydrogenase family)